MYWLEWASQSSANREILPIVRLLSVSMCIWAVCLFSSAWHHPSNTYKQSLWILGKSTRDHPRDTAWSNMFLLIARDVESVHVPVCVSGMFSFFVGCERKSRILLETSPHPPPPTQFLHPLISLCELLCFVYILGDKTQTRNGNERERVGWIWLWVAVLEAAASISSTCIWHLAKYRLLVQSCIADSKRVIHSDMGAHGFFNAKRLLCKTCEKGPIFFLNFPEEFPLPFQPPPPHQHIAGKDIFLWETLT